MALTKTSLPTGMRNLLITVAACTACAPLIIAGTPALARTTASARATASARTTASGVIEHWGSYGTNGKQHDTQLSPVTLTLPGPAVQISSSNSTQYALVSGAVYAWGLGTHGELGNGTTNNSFTKAVKVDFPAGVTIGYLPADVMPYDTAFAVDTTGHVWGWGDNAGGELCLGTTTQYDTPVELPFTAAVTTLDGGADHASYDSGGTLYSCGTNNYGELGNGTFTSSTTPVPVDMTPFNGVAVSTLVASWGNTGALLANGSYFDWGYNMYGELGNGTKGSTADSDIPVQASGMTDVAQVSQGGSEGSNGQTLAMLANGKICAWGADSSSQLGDDKTKPEDTPELITSLPASVEALATGGSTSYAISGAGDVYAWGQGLEGQIGNGMTATQPIPVDVASGATMVSSTSTDVVVSP